MPQFSEADPIVILSYARTPMGAMQGALADATATDLGATAVKAAVDRSGVAPESFDRTYMGCVLPAGLGPPRDAEGEQTGEGTYVLVNRIPSAAI